MMSDEVKAKKSLGQHRLDDVQVLDSICSAADVQPKDTVLEIGPGHGSLTRKLLEKGALVTAVELDEELFQKLQNAQLTGLKIVNEDILSFDLTNLLADYKVVANIPYYLTSNLLRLLCESANPPKSITLLVQKEVAERICASPGKMSILGVSAQVYYETELGDVVPAAKFRPPPKVDSQIVSLHRRPSPLFGELDKKYFFRVVKAGFSNRRKTILNSLSAGLQRPKEVITAALDACDIAPNTRPQQLSIGQWVELAKYLTR